MTTSQQGTEVLTAEQFVALYERLKRWGHFEGWMKPGEIIDFPLQKVEELFQLDEQLAATIKRFVPECRVCGNRNIQIAFISEATRTRDANLIFTPVPKFLNCDSCGQVYYTSRWMDAVSEIQKQIEARERVIAAGMRHHIFDRQYRQVFPR